MATRGRPRTPRGVLAFDSPTWQAPRALSLDTSLVAPAFVQNTPLHAECQGLLLKLVTAGSLIVFNRLLEAELLEAGTKLALESQYGRGWRNRRADGRVRRRANTVTSTLMSAWSEFLTTVDYICVELDEVSSLAPAIMADHGLASYDAIHAATAQYAGASHLATLDTQFGRIAENALTIHVPSSKARYCRSLRGGKP